MAELKDVPLDRLEIDPMNVRPEPGIDPELVDSVRDEGLLEPLVVRPRGDGYGVVIGGRRLAAARQLGLEELPCLIRRNLDDERAEAVSFKENDHREDIPGWKKKQIVQRIYDRTDGRRSKNRRVKEVMEKLNISKGAVYGYVDFEKLDPTVNIRQKEPSERTDEEIELLESSLSENRSVLTGEKEDLEKDEYEREKTRGFPALGKVPTEVGKELCRSDFFLELQDEDLERAHELATEAAEAGQRKAPEVIGEWRREMEGSKREKRRRGGRKPEKFMITVPAKLSDGLDRLVEEKKGLRSRADAAVTAIDNYLRGEGLLED